jgi:hypothetical protein
MAVLLVERITRYVEESCMGYPTSIALLQIPGYENFILAVPDLAGDRA